MKEYRWVQFGCGLCAPNEWINFDSSPTLQLQKMPVIGQFVPAGPYGRFPDNVRYGDIVKGLPIQDRSAQLLYCSHVLEHLSHQDLRIALRNCRRTLADQGTFRLVLPDLGFLIDSYCSNHEPSAAVTFMQDSLLGKRHRSRGLRGFLRDWLGNSNHLWMWDFKSLSEELANAGFTSIRKATYGDSAMAAFGHVETMDRWENALGIECC